MRVPGRGHVLKRNFRIEEEIKELKMGKTPEPDRIENKMITDWGKISIKPSIIRLRMKRKRQVMRNSRVDIVTCKKVKGTI